jgi:hypothetical protein
MDEVPELPDGAIAVNLLSVTSTLRFLRVVFLVMGVVVMIFSLVLISALLKRETTYPVVAIVAFVGGAALVFRAFRVHQFLAAARAGKPMMLVGNALRVVANSQLSSLTLDSGAIARITDPQVPAARVKYTGEHDDDVN